MFDIFLFGSDIMNLPILDNIKTTANKENFVQFAEVFNKLSNLAVSRFKWTNLPDTCNERMLEITLYLCGKALFFNDPTLGYLNTQVNLVGNQNVYYEHIEREAHSINYSKRYTIDDSVLIRNNPTTTPSVYTVYTYSKKISDALRTLDTNMLLLKHPFFFRTEKKEVYSMRQALKQIADNEIGIFGSEAFKNNGDNFDVVDTKTNINLGAVWEHIRNLYSEVYTYLGINNQMIEKKERLIVDEVNANNMAIDMNIESQYKERKYACELINKMFGLDVDVEVKTIKDYTTYIKEGEIIE